MTAMARVLVAAVVIIVAAGTSTPVVGLDPAPEEEALTRMTTLMDAMHRSMQEMRDEARQSPGMRPMRDRLGRAMGMADEMRALMREYREHARQECSAAAPPPAPGKDRR